MTQGFSPYDDDELMRRHVDDGQHRGIIGGLWDELGNQQLEFLKTCGLKPGQAFIDVGAGSFRAGVKLVPYLEPGNYYAIDIQACLLEAGYTREIEPAGLADRFPRHNFVANPNFDVSSFGRTFQAGIAQSVFTHMPITRLSACLTALAPHFSHGGTFFVTVFLAPEERAGGPFRQVPGDVVTRPDRDPYHTTVKALEEACSQVPGWRMTVIGD